MKALVEFLVNLLGWMASAAVSAWGPMVLLPAATGGRFTPGYGQTFAIIVAIWVAWPSATSPGRRRR